MKTFEDCLFFIENTLGIYLLSWQKEVLQKMYENKPFYYRPCRGIGLTTLEKAAILMIEFKKEKIQNESTRN